jgi:hypothetical protein
VENFCQIVAQKTSRTTEAEKEASGHPAYPSSVRIMTLFSGLEKMLLL